jgi:hypothetical protein
LGRDGLGRDGMGGERVGSGGAGSGCFGSDQPGSDPMARSGPVSGDPAPIHTGWDVPTLGDWRPKAVAKNASNPTVLTANPGRRSGTRWIPDGAERPAPRQRFAPQAYDQDPIGREPLGQEPP